MSVTAYIGYGANLGNLVQNYEATKNLLQSEPEITRVFESRLYHSEPLTKNGEKQPWYLNAVLEVETSLSLHALKDVLQSIEKKMGREKRKKWGSRIIDLDILFYGDVVFEDESLKIPHPEMTKRLFVMLPLQDLAPDFVHPEMQMTVRELVALVDTSLKVCLLENFHEKAG